VPRTSRGRELRAVLFRGIRMAKWWRLGFGVEEELADFRGGNWLGGNVPCVRNDDVVEGSVLLAEAGETYP
jgi:hypothetical protein